MRKPFNAVVLVGIGAALGACTNHAVGPLDMGTSGGPPGNPNQVTPVVPGGETQVISRAGVRDVDILFVIDDSAAMTGKQAALAAAYRRFLQTLAGLPDGLPNLHIGVVSASVEAGAAGPSACTGDGELLRQPRVPGCAPPDGGYLSDVALPDGGRRRNYTGSLEDAFACVAQLPPTGCPFAQPLEAMKRALDGHLAANAGFLRLDTLLQIVVVTAQDDCSASDDALFDPSTPGLGPLSPFRCAQAALSCDGVAVRPKTKVYGACKPLETSAYLHPTRRYIDFLAGVSKDPDIVALSALAGDPAPFAVDVGATGAAEVEPSCMAGLGPAVPAVRLSALAEQLRRGQFVSACDGDPATALAQVVKVIRSGTQEPCIAGSVALDTSPDVPGLQPSCTVADEVTRDGTTAEVGVPRCQMLSDTAIDPHGPVPCWWAYLAPDQCPDTQTHLAVSVYRNPTSDRIVTRATCAAQ